MDTNIMRVRGYMLFLVLMIHVQGFAQAPWVYQYSVSGFYFEEAFFSAQKTDSSYVIFGTDHVQDYRAFGLSRNGQATWSYDITTNHPEFANFASVVEKDSSLLFFLMP